MKSSTLTNFLNRFSFIQFIIGFSNIFLIIPYMIFFILSLSNFLYVIENNNQVIYENLAKYYEVLDMTDTADGVLIKYGSREELFNLSGTIYANRLSDSGLYIDIEEGVLVRMVDFDVVIEFLQRNNAFRMILYTCVLCILIMIFHQNEELTILKNKAVVYVNVLSVILLGLSILLAIFLLI